SCYNLDAGTTLIAPQVGGATGAATQVAAKGGDAIGPWDTISSTNFYIDYFRVLLDTAIEDATTVINPIPAGCATTLNNPAAQPTSAAQGGSPAPNSFSYALSNIGTTTVNYAVVKATPAGATTDYTWLSVTPTSGSITPGSNATITANVI